MHVENMIDAFVADLASGLVRKLIILATEEVIQAWNLQENLQRLCERLESINALLSDADTKKINMYAVQNWLNKLKDVSHVADVFMDELSYEVTRKKVENHRRVKDFFHLSKNSIIYRFKVAGKIKYIHTSFDNIFKWAREIGLQPVEHLSSMLRQRSLLFEDTPFEDEYMVVGRVNDASDLVKMLVRVKYTEDLPVIAITGMGGLGKTTLARMVYKSDYVINYFSKRMWVTVSDDFDFMRILNQMVESLTKKSSLLKNPEAVIKKLQEYLKEANFLLVLDDVWNEESRKWDRLRNSLLGVGGARGSRILITTRTQRAIDAMSSCHIHEVQSLSEDDSWALFKQRAFSHGGVLENDEFAVIGRSMVKKCAGLPLAIKTLGGLLRSMRSVRDWLSIRDSETWKSRDVLPSLRLSYNHLPNSSLKRCFAYCSILPKDSVIYKDELVQVWMALGFLLPPRESNLVMEDIGNEYINILLWNSLLQDVVRDEYNNIISCKMHDLVHDLALAVSEDHSVTVKESHKLKDISKAVHVRLEGVENVEPTIPKKNFERIQVLYAGARILGDVLPNLKHLSVLVLDSGEVYFEWPSSFGKLKYLRYLDISSVQNYGLMNQITELYNLQTLRVRDVQQLPEMFCTLINLRHLFIQRKYASTSGRFSGIEQLTCLQTLPPFVVSRDEKCHLGQLGGLNNLRGELQLYHLREVADIEEARKTNLFGKSGVQRLELDWRDEGEDKEYNDADVMEGLKPHPNLKELEIAYFQGTKFASWMMMMENLVKVKFRHCNRNEEVPPLGHLPRLREIEINGMRNVKIIGREFYGAHTVSKTGGHAETVTPMFPSLRKLILRNMPKLERWLEPIISKRCEDEDTMLLFPKLEELIIQRCSKLKTVPSSCFQSLKELDIMNLKTSLILQTMSKKLHSLTTLRLWNIKGEVSSSSSDMGRILEEILRNNCTSLKRLYLIDCQGLTCLTLRSSNFALEELHVRDCPNLKSISVKQSDGLKSLKHLVIMRCLSLVSLSDMLRDQSLQSTLVTLSLGPFSEELDEFPWPFSSSSSSSSSVSFANLKSLHLRGWSKLKYILPEPLLLHDDQLSSTFPVLTSLRLNQFNGLEALPDSLGKLTSLKLLEIRDCKNLARLPTFHKSHSIRTLNISRCPVLLERCAEGSGPEWLKIRHIPNKNDI